MVAGVALLYLGGEGLVRGSSSFAFRMGVKPIVIGLTVVAMGTSFPELVVSVKAAMSGTPDIVVGNVLGSNICNIALVLALCTMIRPIQVHSQFIKKEVPIMIATSALALALLWLNSGVGRVAGSFLFFLLLVHVVMSVISAAKERNQIVQHEAEEGVPQPLKAAWLDWVYVIGGLALLTYGASLFVDGAIYIAQVFGVSEAVIGLTVVAVGTSLPELASSLVAAWKGEGDLALGNVIGSNIFNILGVLGVTAMVHPVATNGISHIDLLMVLTVSVLLFIFMKTKNCITRLEGGILFTFYVAYTAYLLL